MKYRPALNSFRGVPGTHAKLLSAMKLALKYSAARRVETGTILLKQNAVELGRIAEWAGAARLDGAIFYALNPRGRSWQELMPDASGAAAAVDELTRLKRLGVRVNNSFGHLARMKAHYAAPTAESAPAFCLAAVTARIRHDGDVYVCPFTPPVGNVRAGGFWKVWDSAAARAAREKAAFCGKPCGSHSCHFQPGLLERIWEFAKRTPSAARPYSKKPLRI